MHKSLVAAELLQNIVCGLILFVVFLSLWRIDLIAREWDIKIPNAKSRHVRRWQLLILMMMKMIMLSETHTHFSCHMCTVCSSDIFAATVIPTIRVRGLFVRPHWKLSWLVGNIRVFLPLPQNVDRFLSPNFYYWFVYSPARCCRCAALLYIAKRYCHPFPIKQKMSTFRSTVSC